MALPDTPLTRGEVFLNAIANESSDVPTPLTREEQYLNAIAKGDTSGIPDAPMTREEQYLDYIAKNGGGGGGGGSSELAVWKVGFFGNAMGANATSITVHINGYNGKYAIISVMHRDTLTAPSGCVLLDKATLDDNANIQYVSVFKYHIQSNSVSLTFDQASSARINASAWVVESDYKLSQRETKAWNDYFNSPLSVSTSAQTLALFNAYTSQTGLTTVNLIADSDGAWINQQYAGWNTPSTGAFIYQVRHYSGIIPAVPKLSKFTWWVSNGVSITTVCNAEMYLYTISKA